MIQRALAMCLLISLVAGPAAAQQRLDEATRALARDLYDQATEAYERGDYQLALDNWTRTYELTGAAVVLYGIGNAQERLGLLEGAIESLTQYRASLGEGEEKRLLELRIANLESRLELQRAEEERRRLEEQARLEEAAERERIAREEQARLERELMEERLVQARRDPLGLRITRWTALGGAVAAATTGLVFTVRAEGIASRLNDDCMEVSGGGLLCSSDYRDDWDHHSSSQKAALISYGVAGGLAALFLTTAFIHPNRDVTLDDLAFEPVFYANGAGFRWRTRF